MFADEEPSSQQLTAILDGLAIIGQSYKGCRRELLGTRSFGAHVPWITEANLIRHVGGFAVMNHHIHLLLRLDPEVAAGWSEEEVVRRWELFRLATSPKAPLPISDGPGV